MNRLRIIGIVLAVLINGCSESGGKRISLDGEKLLKEKCSSCHNLDMPAKTGEDEVAPPMLAVVFHLKDWMKVDNPSEKRPKFISFVKDYVLHPSREKSYCDLKSLETYGLMPSQEGKVGEEELTAIASFIYDNYDQRKLLETVKEINRIKRLPPWKQVLETRDCRMCHILNAGRLAPSFDEIAERYAKSDDGMEHLKKSIMEGSRGRWPSYKVPMRSYGDLTAEQLEGVAEWIMNGADHVE